MAVTMVCPNLVCAQVMKVEEGQRGSNIRCCCCHQVFRVPQRSQASRTLFAGGRLLQDKTGQSRPRPNVMDVAIPPLNPIMSDVNAMVASGTPSRRRAVFEIWSEVQRRRTEQS